MSRVAVRPFALLGALFVCGLAFAAPAAPQAALPRYTIRAVEVPDGVFPGPEAVNERGDVLIWTSLTDRTQHAYVWTGKKLTDVGTLGGKNTYGHDLNDRGQVVGVSDTAKGERHAFLWQGGKMRDLGTLGGKQSEAWGINNRGEVVGSADTANGESHAFLWRDGKMLDLGLQSRASTAMDVNERGQVAGQAVGPSGHWESFLWEDGKARLIGVLPAFENSSSWDINAAGDVLAVSYRGGPHDSASQPFLHRAGRNREVVTLGGSNTNTFALNSRGDIVGVSFQAPVAQRPAPNSGEKAQRSFLNRDGKVTDLNALLPKDSGWNLHWVRAINDRGQMVGSGKLNGKSAVYLLTPHER